MKTTAKYKPNIEIISDPAGIARRSIEILISDAQKAIKEKNIFYLAISGGHTPQQFFKLIGESPQTKSLQWDKVQLFWVDERYVKPDSLWSNYKLAADTFLDKVPIPKGNIHRIPTEHIDFKDAAHAYEETIRNVFNLRENQIPEFDLIILGMGTEGHTGSLFPNSYATFDTEDLATVVYVMDEKLNRITLTHPVLCGASHLIVLVSGEEKAEILKEVFTGEPDEVRYPIHTLWPILDRVTWLVDSKAAKHLR